MDHVTPPTTPGSAQPAMTKPTLYRRIMCKLGFHTVLNQPDHLLTITRYPCACCDKTYIKSMFADFYRDKDGNLS